MLHGLACRAWIPPGTAPRCQRTSRGRRAPRRPAACRTSPRRVARRRRRWRAAAAACRMGRPWGLRGRRHRSRRSGTPARSSVVRSPGACHTLGCTARRRGGARVRAGIAYVSWGGGGPISSSGGGTCALHPLGTTSTPFTAVRTMPCPHLEDSLLAAGQLRCLRAAAARHGRHQGAGRAIPVVAGGRTLVAAGQRRAAHAAAPELVPPAPLVCHYRAAVAAGRDDAWAGRAGACRGR